MMIKIKNMYFLFVITSYHPLMFLRTRLPIMKPPIIGVAVNVIGIQGMVILLIMIKECYYTLISPSNGQLLLKLI